MTIIVITPAAAKARARGKAITQVQLAHSIGKDQQSIQRLETGKINPTYYYLTEIATGLKTTVSELLNDL